MVRFIRQTKGPGNDRCVGRSIYIGDGYDMKLSRIFASAAPNWGAYMGIPSVQAKNELLPKRHVSFLGADSRMGIFPYPNVLRQSPASLDLLNTRYIIVPDKRDQFDLKKWRTFRGQIRLPSESPQTPVLNNNESISLQLPGTSRTNRLFIYCGIQGSAHLQNTPSLNILLRDGEKTLFNKTFIYISEIPDVIPKGNIQDPSIHDGFLKYSELMRMKEIILTAPASSGEITCTMTFLLPSSLLAIFEVILVDPDNNIIKRFHLITEYIEDVLHYPLIYSDKDVIVYGRPTAFPRQWLTPALAVLSADRILSELDKASRTPDINPGLRDIALVEDESLGEFADQLRAAAADDSATIERILDRPNNLAVKVVSEAPVFAVLSEAWLRVGKPNSMGNRSQYIYLTITFAVSQSCGRACHRNAIYSSRFCHRRHNIYFITTDDGWFGRMATGA